MKNCRELMTPDPVCCLGTDKVYSIAQLMQKEDIGAVPVVDNHSNKILIGVITDRDLALRVVGASRDATSTTVSEVMTQSPQVCRPDDEIDKTLAQMVKHQLRRIPVVDTNNQIIGIIAQADIALGLNDNRKVGEWVADISEPDGIPVD